MFPLDVTTLYNMCRYEHLKLPTNTHKLTDRHTERYTHRSAFHPSVLGSVSGSFSLSALFSHLLEVKKKRGNFFPLLLPSNRFSLPERFRRIDCNSLTECKVRSIRWIEQPSEKPNQPMPLYLCIYLLHMYIWMHLCNVQSTICE